MGAKTDIAGMGAKTDLRSDIRGMGATSSRRAVPVGEPVDPMTGATSKLPPLKNADVWPEDPTIAGRLSFKGPRTVDTTAERIVPRLGMRDDATLNAAADDIIESAMAAVPKGIGYSPAAAPVSKAAQMTRMRALRDLAIQQSKEDAFRRMGR
jgi:hypothetical protein